MIGSMKIAALVLALLVLAVAVFVTKENCTPDSPKGPTIGGVIKIAGC